MRDYRSLSIGYKTELTIESAFPEVYVRVNPIRTSSPSEMRKALRYSLFLSVLLTLTFSLTSCDSGGSNGSSSSPEWTGNWKVIKENGESTDADAAWSISEDEIKAVSDFRGDCAVDGDPSRWKITNVDGNTLTIEGQTDGALDAKLEADVGGDGNLTTTLVSGGDAPEGSTQTWKPIDESIEEAVGC